MRILVLSDIHANLAAFEAVLADARGQWDELWCLGDVIGYGPDPNECVGLLRAQPHITLVGNHDHAALGRLDVSTFNDDARRAVAWTRRTLSDDARDYLLAQEGSLIKEPFTLAHGSPREPIWEYITDSFIAWENFNFLTTAYCLVGHTHYPAVFVQSDLYGAVYRAADYSAPLQLGDERMIINPGSVGQPRDSDPRAAYALLDLETLQWQHRRVAYPIEITQQRMTAHDLPRHLIERLRYGW